MGEQSFTSTTQLPNILFCKNADQKNTTSSPGSFSENNKYAKYREILQLYAHWASSSLIINTYK